MVKWVEFKLLIQNVTCLLQNNIITKTKAWNISRPINTATFLFFHIKSNRGNSCVISVVMTVGLQYHVSSTASISLLLTRTKLDISKRFSSVQVLCQKASSWFQWPHNIDVCCEHTTVTRSRRKWGHHFGFHYLGHLGRFRLKTAACFHLNPSSHVLCVNAASHYSKYRRQPWQLTGK